MVPGDILRLRLRRNQKPQKVNVRRIPCVEQLSNVHQLQGTEDHSCEAELHTIVSSASDRIYILEFALGAKVDHYIFTDSLSACQLVMKRGVGKVRHLDGKLLRKYQQIATIQSHLEDKESDT